MGDAIHNTVEGLKKSLVECRRDLHKHPESGWTEFRTASIVAGKLKELGYTLTMGAEAVSKKDMMGVPSEAALKEHRQRALAQGADPALVELMEGGATGLWADLACGGGPGPRMALRFDLDANDVQETDDAAHRPAQEGFASTNKGVMHACGHDGHVAIGLAVAEALAGMKDQLKGSIRLIFQPAEEGVRGAGPMVAAGCCDGVDIIAGLHIGFQAAEKGDLICGTKGFLATTKWDVTFNGKSAHAGAAPEEGKNALLAACAATTNMHAIARHSGGATRITVGKLSGGQGRNVIPPEAFMAIETRGMTSALNDYMTSEARRIIEAAAAMWDCSYKIKVVGGTKSGESSEDMLARVQAIAKTMPAFTNIIAMQDFGASEDFSHMMAVVQEHGGVGGYIQIGAARTAGHHNDHFDFDEEVLPLGTELLIRLVKEYLGA